MSQRKLHATQRQRLLIWFSKRSISIPFMKRAWCGVQRKRVVRTRGGLYDLDMVRRFVAPISTFGLARFSEAGVGHVMAQGLGATAGSLARPIGHRAHLAA